MFVPVSVWECAAQNVNIHYVGVSALSHKREVSEHTEVIAVPPLWSGLRTGILGPPSPLSRNFKMDIWWGSEIIPCSGIFNQKSALN